MRLPPATDANRPPPSTPATRDRWATTGVAHRMISGAWQEDAERRLAEFFGEEVVDFQPSAVTAICLLRSFAEQTATLYNGPVTVHVEDAAAAAAAAADTDTDTDTAADTAADTDDGPPLRPLKSTERKALGLGLLWAQQQTTLEQVRALNDSLVLREWKNAHRAVRYQTVAPDEVEADPDPTDPTQPCRVMHHRRRMVEGVEVWCRDVWDREAGTFRIDAWSREEAETKGRWVDVTVVVMPELALLPGRYPYWTNPWAVEVDGVAVPPPDGWEWGDPIWPWTAYHHRVGAGLFTPQHGAELRDLTLIVAVLWTYALCLARDVAIEQRGIVDGHIPGKTTPGPNGVPYTSVSPNKVLHVKSDNPAVQQAVMDAWASAVDLPAYFEAVARLMVLGAMYAGLSAGDVDVSTQGLSRVSGAAITVSRAGVRRIEAQMVAPMAIGDADNLAGAAALVRAYGGGVGDDLSTDPTAYALVYTETPKGPEEIRAEVEEVTNLVAARLMHPAVALRRFNPHLTLDEAKAQVEEICAYHRALAGETVAETEPETDAAETDAAETDAAETEADNVADASATVDEQPLAATALNGAQVTAALEIVSKVAVGALPRESGVAMLVAFFQLTKAAAEEVMGAVGRGFVPAPVVAPGFASRPAPPVDADEDEDEVENNTPDEPVT